MPAQAAVKKPPTKAEIALKRDEMAHRETMASHQKDMARVNSAEAAKDRSHEKDMADHEMELALLDPQVRTVQGLDRLQRMPHLTIAGHVSAAIKSIAKLHGSAHSKLTANDDQFRRAKLRSDEQRVDGVTDTKPKSNGKTLVTVDPPLPTPRDAADQLEKMRLRPANNRFRSKKKLREQLEEAEDHTPPVKEVWFTGTYTPFSDHHAKAVKETMKQYGSDVRPYIGITGKQKPPGFQLPLVPKSVDSLDDYLGHVKIAYNSYLKTNTPIELKMAVAKAAHPDLADHMVWVKDAFGTPVDGKHKGPAPGAVIHSDTLFNQPADSTRYAYTQHNGDPARLHHGTQTFIKEPKMILDADGEKQNTTPIRLALITAHAIDGYPDHHINSLHSQLLGVPMDHPGVQQSRRMFDWMARGWQSIEHAATTHYNLERPANDNTVTEDRRHAAGVGERLLRGQSLQSVGKRIGTKATPPTNEAILMKRAKRAARYDLRKKLAPNYTNLSTGQKQDIDERVAKHAEFKKLTDSHYKEYRKKYAERAHTSSHNKKPKE